jgi:hypothetical protein
MTWSSDYEEGRIMAALLKLAVGGWEAETVLLPEGQGIRITVFGEWFPIRAVEPEILVGDLVAERTEVMRDLRRVRGYLRKMPKDGARIVVRYGDSQEGVVKEPFNSRRVRPIPNECR